MVTKINFASKFIQMHLVAAHYTDPPDPPRWVRGGIRRDCKGGEHKERKRV